MTTEELFQLPPLSAPETAAGPEPARALDDAELARQLAAENFSALDDAAQCELVYADVRTAVRLREEGKLSRFHRQHVAFLRGQFVGASSDLEHLYQELRERFQVGPDRPAVLFIDDFWA